MKYFLSAELYRMKKSKSPLLLLIACFALSFLSGVLYGFMFGNAPWLQRMYEAYLGLNPFAAAQEITITGLNAIGSYADLIGYALKANIGIYVVLFIAIFLIPLRRSGYIKNIASVHPRSEVFFAHALLIAVFAFLLVDAASLAMVLSSFIFFRGLPVGSIPDLLVFLLTDSLLLSAIGIVVLTLTDLLRRQMPAIIFSIVYLWLVAPTMFSIAEASRMLNPGMKFRLRYVSLVGNLLQMQAGHWNMVLSALLAAVVYVGLCVLLEMTVIRRRDLI